MMTEEVQRGVGLTIGLLAQFILFYSYGAAPLRQDEPYLIGVSAVVVILILIFGIRFAPHVDDNDMLNLPSEVLSQKLERLAVYNTVRNILLMIAYAFGAGGVMVLLFF